MALVALLCLAATSQRQAAVAPIDCDAYTGPTGPLTPDAGLTFIPHTNRELPVSSTMFMWRLMTGQQDSAAVLLPGQSFVHAGGLGPAISVPVVRETTSRTCTQHSNAGKNKKMLELHAANLFSCLGHR